MPFENLDIHLGRPIVLTIEALQVKQVDAGQSRGGFCYELSGLMAHHLRALGYCVTLLCCHFRHDAHSFGPAFDHLALLVTLGPEEQWLLDVGSIPHPLRLTPGDALQPDGGTYRLVHDLAPDTWTLFERRHEEEAFVPQFRFDRSSWELPDYIPMCHEQATSPESHFTHGRLCSRATPTGRISLSEHRLIITDNGERHEVAITTNAEFENALWANFGIDLRGADWQPPLAPPDSHTPVTTGASTEDAVPGIATPASGPQRSFATLTPRGQAGRVRELASTALAAYDVDVRRVSLLSNDLNGIFRVDLTDGSRRMLRVSEPTWRSDSDLHAELAWLQTLAQTDIGAPLPYPNRDGALVTWTSIPGVPEPRRCVLFSWIPGQPIAKSLTQPNVAKMGALSAHLHTQAASVLLPSDVQVHRFDRLFPRGETPVYFSPEFAHVVTPYRAEVLQRAIERANEGFATLNADPGAWRLIHGDLHHENVLLHRGRVRPVDFEDIVLGHPAQDIALTFYDFLYFTDPKQHDFDSLCRWFRDGYIQVSPWPAPDQRSIHNMLIARRVWVVNWVLLNEPPAIHEIAMESLTKRFEHLLALD